MQRRTRRGDVAAGNLEPAREKELRQRVLQLVGVLEALIGLAREGAPDHLVELLWDLRVERRQRRNARLSYQLDGLVIGLSVEEAAPGQHLEEDDADGEDVGAVVDLASAGRLRR